MEGRGCKHHGHLLSNILLLSLVINQNNIMKKVVYLFAMASLGLFSCTRDNPPGPVPASSLDGKWKMVSSKDNISGTVMTKPATEAADVEIIFTLPVSDTGSFTAKTANNEIGKSYYYLGTHQAISIPVINSTKVGETLWGGQFVFNILNSQSYFFETDGKLDIVTSVKTLAFVKE